MTKISRLFESGTDALVETDRLCDGLLCYPGERCGLFIDGANLCNTAKRMGIALDFRQLLSYFRNKTRLVTARYYSTLFIDEQDRCSLRPLIDWLNFNGFTTVTWEMRRNSRLADERGEDRERVAVELSVDAMALSDTLDHIIIFAGDSCFAPMVRALKRKGKRVTLISSLNVSPVPISDELRRAAEGFVELQVLAPHLEGRSDRPALE